MTDKQIDQAEVKASDKREDGLRESREAWQKENAKRRAAKFANAAAAAKDAKAEMARPKADRK